MGTALRTVRRQAKSTGRGEIKAKEKRTPVPHVRRAHWHSYWTGPRKEPKKRELIVKWMPPVPVGFTLEEVERLMPTIRKIKH
jgi:hypothetical protein